MRAGTVERSDGLSRVVLVGAGLSANAAVQIRSIRGQARFHRQLLPRGALPPLALAAG